MDRQEALDLLHKNLKNKNLRKHCYAVEAVMADLAEHFGEDKELWSIAGLLHDIDYEDTKDESDRHSLVGGKMLEEKGLPAEVVHAVIAHNPAHGVERETLFDKALYAADPVTGLIVAAALISPEKKLSAIDTQFVMNRFGEKSFARGANREQIKSCSEMGMELEDFIDLSLKAMQKISGDLGL
jgi:putative nucleotidyltransferase with HDIG domain